FADNWELSQARALSVVRFMQNALGFPPERLAATGFGEYRPVVEGTTEAVRQQNRRIELKLTER
ncbi:MAG: OmpA family protein, partial [Paracoccaceae bacterium]